MTTVTFFCLDPLTGGELTGEAEISKSEFNEEYEWTPFQSLAVRITEIRDGLGNALPLDVWTREQMEEMKSAAVDALYRIPLLEPAEFEEAA